MMKTISCLIALVFLAGCTKSAYNSHNSMNSLDWEGVYTGHFQDSEAISVLTLKENLTYELSQNGVRSHGGFVWSEDGGRIAILGEGKTKHFRVGENILIAVDRKGKLIEKGEIVFHKRDDLSVTEKYWKLTELNGKPVIVKEGMREPHLILKNDSENAKGHGGCNNFTASYSLDETKGNIRFLDIISTRMACGELEMESDLFQVLKGINHFTTDGDNLSFYREEAKVMARFVVVYLK